MKKNTSLKELSLSKRERQIMKVIMEMGEASVSDIMERIPDAPTSGAARRLLNIMRDKGLLKSKQDGPRKLYFAAKSMPTGILDRVVETFFGGSTAKAMAALFESSDAVLTEQEHDVLEKLIKKTRENEK